MLRCPRKTEAKGVAQVIRDDEVHVANPHVACRIEIAAATTHTVRPDI